VEAGRFLEMAALLLGHGARTTLLLAPLAPSGRPCGIGYLAPLGSHRALPFQEITPAFVSFESLSGINNQQRITARRAMLG